MENRKNNQKPTNKAINPNSSISITIAHLSGLKRNQFKNRFNQQIRSTTYVLSTRNLLEVKL